MYIIVYLCMCIFVIGFIKSADLTDDGICIIEVISTDTIRGDSFLFAYYNNPRYKIYFYEYIYFILIQG